MVSRFNKQMNKQFKQSNEQVKKDYLPLYMVIDQILIM